MNQYSAAWLLDRQLDAGHGDRIAYRIDGRSVSYAGCATRYGGPRTPCVSSTCAGERVALVVDDELAFPAWFGALRTGAVPVPLSTMRRDELAAIVADAGAGTVVVSAGYQEHLAALAAGPSELRNAVVIGDPGPQVGFGHGWSAFTDRSEAWPPPGRTRRRSGSTAPGRPAPPRGDAPPRQPPGHGRDLRGRCSRSGPTTRCLSVAKLFFAYGLDNSLTFPLSVGAAQCSIPGVRRRPTCLALPGRTAHPVLRHPASSPHCSTPTPRTARSPRSEANCHRR